MFIFIALVDIQIYQQKRLLLSENAHAHTILQNFELFFCALDSTALFKNMRQSSALGFCSTTRNKFYTHASLWYLLQCSLV